jgi:hypothetical protein
MARVPLIWWALVRVNERVRGAHILLRWGSLWVSKLLEKVRNCRFDTKEPHQAFILFWLLYGCLNPHTLSLQLTLPSLISSIVPWPVSCCPFIRPLHLRMLMLMVILDIRILVKWVHICSSTVHRSHPYRAWNNHLLVLSHLSVSSRLVCLFRRAKIVLRHRFDRGLA